MVWKFSQVRVIEGQLVPREPKLVQVIGSFEKSGVKLLSLSEASPRETRISSKYREVRETDTVTAWQFMVSFLVSSPKFIYLTRVGNI